MYLLHLEIDSLTVPTGLHSWQIEQAVNRVHEESEAELLVVLEIIEILLGWDELHKLFSYYYGVLTSAKTKVGSILLATSVFIKNYSLIPPDGVVLEFPASNLNESKETLELKQNSLVQYDNVALGGTFDHLHNGHKILLSMAALITTKTIRIGVTNLTGERLHKKKYFEMIQDLITRISNVELFVSRFKPILSVNVISIDDEYGPAGSDENLEAIVGSQETAGGCALGIIILKSQ